MADFSGLCFWHLNFTGQHVILMSLHVGFIVQYRHNVGLLGVKIPDLLGFIALAVAIIRFDPKTINHYVDSFTGKTIILSQS